MADTPNAQTPSVFISYSSVDRSLVTSLVAYLEAEGFLVWWDRAIEAGEEFDRQIEAKLSDSSCAVVVWSPDSIRSKWVLSEAMAAFDRNRLIPVRLDADLSVPLPFNRLHTASLEGWTGDRRHPGLEELSRGIRTLIQGGRPHEREVADDSPDRRTVVAVLPFDDQNAGHNTNPLCGQLPDALINALSRFSDLDALSRRASFAPELAGLEIRTLARTLRVDCVVTGSVAEYGDHVVVSVELTDGKSGRQLWAMPWRLPRSALDDVAAVASDFARTLSGVFLNLALSGTADDGGEAWQLITAGRKILLRNTEEAIEQARDKARRALDSDPENGHACALLASALVEAIVNGHADDIQALRAEAIELTDRALLYCVDDPVILKYAGHILASCGEHEQGVKALRRALDLNPYDDGAYGYLGWGLAPSTAPEHLSEIIPVLERLLRDVRKHPGRPFWMLHLSVAHTCSADFESAYGAAREALEFSPKMRLAWLHAANALGQLGREDDARALMKRYPLDVTTLRPRVLPIIDMLSRDAGALRLRTDGLLALSLA
jgi:TolB-like protein/Tfp pilus assembly protein PilF